MEPMTKMLSTDVTQRFHEINNALGVILINVEALACSGLTAEDARETASDALECARDLNRQLIDLRSALVGQLGSF